MTWRIEIRGEYPPDWSEIADRVRVEAGHRCIRCGHPYRTGQHGKGEWSPCDKNCNHDGPLQWMNETTGLTEPIPNARNIREVFRVPVGEAWIADMWPHAQWRILTVHHLDGDKSNCRWWNLLALCQRCHLQIQGRLNPETPYFLEHSEWFKPYVAGFYAQKYLSQDLSRQEAIARMPELLALEQLA